MDYSRLHSFAICAHGESPYLEECIKSVTDQSLTDSEIFISTSTPSDWLTDIASRYNLRVFVNTGEHGIGQDWNFAYSCAGGRYVTIAHQDDIYCRDYAKTAVTMLERATKPLIFFCDYGEIRDGSLVDSSLNLTIKRRLLHGLKNGRRADSISARRRALSLGCAISCPSVTLDRENCPSAPYQTRMKCSLDWDTWEHLSRLEGSFVYAAEILMYHRIHEESATTKLISNNTRLDEDKEMFNRFWPKPIALLLAKAYTVSFKSNELKTARPKLS